MELLVLACLAIFWFAVFFEYTPSWETVYDADRVYINLLWTLATGGLVMAAVSASTINRPRAWPHRYVRVGPVTLTWVGGVFWTLVFGAIVSWYCLRLIPDFEEYNAWKYILDVTSALTGKVSMIPISLLGVPLSRSSGLWRMAGLAYEECVAFHRWLGILTVALVTLHGLGYIVLWLSEGPHQLVHELFSEWGVGGLNPFCRGVHCNGVSNVAGLIATVAGLLIWASSIERVRRSSYPLFIQTHQLHYVFFGMACAHWWRCVMFIMPAVVFYAADVALRNHGTEICSGATARVHGLSATPCGEPADSGQPAEPHLVTLVLPVPEAGNTLPAAPTQTGCCPYLERHSAEPNGLLSAVPDAATSLNSPESPTQVEADPWAGSTVYIRIPQLSCWWSHPFTVAGSVALDAEAAAQLGRPRALLVNIAPERRWTRSLARLATSLNGGEDALLPRVFVTGPLPAPPHIEHLARDVMAGRPLLLVGAGSGMTPALALIRLLASRAVPPRARVRFVAVARSLPMVEMLDALMLPLDVSGATGLPWLDTEIHITRVQHTEPPTASLLQVDSRTRQLLNGGVRLGSVSGGNVRAIAKPFGLSDQAELRPTATSKCRSSTTDEVASITGAFGGFLCVAWPLLWQSENAPFYYSHKPLFYSGLVSLVLAWLGALLGAFTMLCFADWIGGRAGWGSYSSSRHDASVPIQHSEIPETGPESEAGSAEALVFALASNGTRPNLCKIADDFTAELTRSGAPSSHKIRVAVGGPARLGEELRAAVPRGVALTRLTHEM